MPKPRESSRLLVRARRRGQVLSAGVGMSPKLPFVSSVARAQQLSLDWRVGDTPSLRRRRHAATSALAAGSVMMGLSLYQLGVVKELPELPFEAFKANRVDASAQAYQAAGMPDATLGVVSYAVTAALASAGGAQPPAWLTFALATKASIDVAWALKLTADQAFKHRAACSWCLLTTGLTLATFAYTALEAQAAWKKSQ